MTMKETETMGTQVTQSAMRAIACLAHEVNRAYCAALGDDSQPPWDEAPDWQRDSAFDGVMFHLEHPDAGPSGSHENWLRHKQADGWVYGETKDPDAKTHPCMVPFEQLPVEQKVKDHLFTAIVHTAARQGPSDLIRTALEQLREGPPSDKTGRAIRRLEHALEDLGAD